VVVVALNSLSAGPSRPARETRPDALAGAGQILLGLLQDQLVGDLQTLATVNTLTRATRIVPDRKRRVPYIVIAPARHDSIARRALRVYREHYDAPWKAIRSPSIALLGRLVAGGLDAQHAELLSFLLFAPEFGKALIELGRQDAQRWITGTRDLDDLWQLSPL
jgi:NTE family protein